MHTRTYRRLSYDERETISRGLAAGKTQADIAIELGRSRSTITREVKARSGENGYRAFPAESDAQFTVSGRRWRSHRLLHHQRLRQYVHEKLTQRWSPEMISKRLPIAYPHDMTMRISHEAIYQYLYILPRGELRKTLIKALRRHHPHRRTRRAKRPKSEETRGHIPNMLSIEERPAEVADRSVPGHWEGDLIVGRYHQSALGTLVERTTRYTMLVPLGKKQDAVSVRRAYTRAFKRLPATLTKTLTYDQGREMSDHVRFTVATGMEVYFAHPASPWERGTNENTNGLLRQYFPKGTDFTTVSRYRIRQVERELNDRPRAVLDYLKPNEVITKLLR